MFRVIAGWVALFAAGMLVALLSDRENRRKNAPLALAMFAILAAAGYLIILG